MNWDTLFMSMVYLVAMKSKDDSTHLGAVIVSQDNEIRSFGYNGLARGINDDVVERQERPEKYFWFEHAERNAIYNAGRMAFFPRSRTTSVVSTSPLLILHMAEESTQSTESSFRFVNST